MEKQTEPDILKDWKLHSTVPSNFNASVWRRIEQQGATHPSLATILADGFANLFARPVFALSYASVALVLGLAAGHLHSTSALEKHSTQLEARYLQSVDPYAPRVIE
jgi:hypothetical protein